MSRYSPVIALVTFFVALGVAHAADQPTSANVISEFQKETAASIREITLQLLLLAVGVIALIGGFAADNDKSFTARPLAALSFTAFVISVAAGLLTYGSLIYMLGHDKFEPFGQITGLAMTQWVSFGVGGFLFALFVFRNMRKRA